MGVEALRPNFCPECGAAVKQAGRFCGGCGKEILTGGPKPAAVPSPEAPRVAQEGPSTVDPAIVLAGGWLAMASPSLRAAKGAKLAMSLAAMLGGTTLAALVWWFMYVGDRRNIDASMLQTISIGSLAAFALGVMANVRLARGAPSGAGGGSAKALVAFPLAVALLSLGMVPSVERTITDARETWRRAQENPQGVDLEARNRAYFGPKPSSKPVAVDPTFPVK